MHPTFGSGTRFPNPSYQATYVPDGGYAGIPPHPGRHVSITSMDFYKQKSYEELRWEDCKDGQDGPSPSTSQCASVPTAPSLFGPRPLTTQSTFGTQPAATPSLFGPQSSLFGPWPSTRPSLQPSTTPSPFGPGSSTTPHHVSDTQPASTPGASSPFVWHAPDDFVWRPLEPSTTPRSPFMSTSGPTPSNGSAVAAFTPWPPSSAFRPSTSHISSSAPGHASCSLFDPSPSPFSRPAPATPQSCSNRTFQPAASAQQQAPAADAQPFSFTPFQNVCSGLSSRPAHATTATNTTAAPAAAESKAPAGDPITGSGHTAAQPGIAAANTQVNSNSDDMDSTSPNTPQATTTTTTTAGRITFTTTTTVSTAGAVTASVLMPQVVTSTTAAPDGTVTVTTTTTFKSQNTSCARHLQEAVQQQASGHVASAAEDSTTGSATGAASSGEPDIIPPQGLAASRMQPVRKFGLVPADTDTESLPGSQPGSRSATPPLSAPSHDSGDRSTADAAAGSLAAAVAADVAVAAVSPAADSVMSTPTPTLVVCEGTAALVQPKVLGSAAGNDSSMSAAGDSSSQLHAAAEDSSRPPKATASIAGDAADAAATAVASPGATTVAACPAYMPNEGPATEDQPSPTMGSQAASPVHNTSMRAEPSVKPQQDTVSEAAVPSAITPAVDTSTVAVTANNTATAHVVSAASPTASPTTAARGLASCCMQELLSTSEALDEVHTQLQAWLAEMHAQSTAAAATKDDTGSEEVPVADQQGSEADAANSAPTGKEPVPAAAAASTARAAGYAGQASAPPVLGAAAVSQASLTLTELVRAVAQGYVPLISIPEPLKGQVMLWLPNAQAADRARQLGFASAEQLMAAAAAAVQQQQQQQQQHAAGPQAGPLRTAVSARPVQGVSDEQAGDADDTGSNMHSRDAAADEAGNSADNTGSGQLSKEPNPDEQGSDADDTGSEEHSKDPTADEPDSDGAGTESPWEMVSESRSSSAAGIAVEGDATAADKAVADGGNNSAAVAAAAADTSTPSTDAVDKSSGGSSC